MFGLTPMELIEKTVAAWVLLSLLLSLLFIILGAIAKVGVERVLSAIVALWVLLLMVFIAVPLFIWSVNVLFY